MAIPRLAEDEVFTEVYSDLFNTLTDVDNLLPHFVQKKIISTNDLTEIIAVVAPTKKVMKLLTHISGPLKAGNTKGFYDMLRIMEDYGNQATMELANQMRGLLSASCVAEGDHSIDSSQSTMSTSSGSSIDFTDLDNIADGFLYLTTKLCEILKEANLSKLKKAFWAKVPGGVQLSCELEGSIKVAKKHDDLLELLVKSKHCNFVNVRLLNSLAISSGIKAAKELIERYKQTYFNIKLSDILDMFVYKASSDQRKQYVARVGSKISKEPDEITIADLSKYYTDLELLILDIHEGSCTLEHINKGCVMIQWTIPIEYSLHAYKSALINRDKFYSIHLEYLQIEPYPAIYDPFTIQPAILTKLLYLPNPITSTPAEVVAHYHHFLSDSLSSDVLYEILDGMKLLKDSDNEALTHIGSEYQKNAFLLDRLLAVDTESCIIEFCHLLQSTEDHQECGQVLVNAIRLLSSGNDDVILPSQSTESSLENVDSSEPDEYLNAKKVRITHLTVVAQLKMKLKEYDPQVLFSACNRLCASTADHSEVAPLVPPDYINPDSVEDTLNRLDFFWSWNNCSVLRTLLEACGCNDGLQQLESFESHIDTSQTIDYFPIARPSSKMAPTSGLCTVLTIRSEVYKNNQLVSLQYIRDVAAIVVERFGISHHALHLLAVTFSPIIICWAIPKSVVSFLEVNVHQQIKYLEDNGISEIVVYPNLVLFSALSTNLTMRSIAHHQEDPLVSSLEEKDKRLEQAYSQIKMLINENEELNAVQSEHQMQSKKMERSLSDDVDSVTSQLQIKSHEIDILKKEKNKFAELYTKYHVKSQNLEEEVKRLTNDVANLQFDRLQETEKLKSDEQGTEPKFQAVYEDGADGIARRPTILSPVATDSSPAGQAVSVPTTIITPSTLKLSVRDIIEICPKGTDRPSIKELDHYIGAAAVPYWVDLGVHLLDSEWSDQLNVIKEEYPGDDATCCTKMFARWLLVDSDASWDKLVEALETIDQTATAEIIRRNVLKDSEVTQKPTDRTQHTITTPVEPDETNGSPLGDDQQIDSVGPVVTCSAFLIGANISGEKVPDNAAIAREPFDKSKNPLDGVLKDLNSMTGFMGSRKIPVYEVMLGSRHVKPNKRAILQAFRKFFCQKGTQRFVIYYSGHGSNGTFESSKGDWCFETTSGSGTKIIYIGLKDILDLWDEMRFQFGCDSNELKDRALLFIIADSCYSGNWVEEIKTKRDHKTTPSGENYRDVHMIASCQSQEICYYSIAYGGDFTRRYVTADSSKHNLSDTASHVAKLVGQSVVQGITFPLYMPVKGLANYFNTKSHKHTPVATNDKERYRILLMKYDGEKLPIGRGLGIASGWSWMLSGQIFHN